MVKVNNAFKAVAVEHVGLWELPDSQISITSLFEMGFLEKGPLQNQKESALNPRTSWWSPENGNIVRWIMVQLSEE